MILCEGRFLSSMQDHHLSNRTSELLRADRQTRRRQETRRKGTVMEAMTQRTMYSIAAGSDLEEVCHDRENSGTDP